MNPYDQAHALARSLKDSEEYQHFSGTIIYRKTIDLLGTDGVHTVPTGC